MRRYIWILGCCAWISACVEAKETKIGCLAQLSEDMSVELIGIRPYGAGHPKRMKGRSGPWWRPDGTPLETSPDERQDLCSWSDSYLFVIAIETKADCDFRAVGPWGHDLTIQPVREFEKGQRFAEKDLRRFTLRIGNQKSADIRLHVATGEWKTTDRWFVRPDWTPYNLILSSLEKAILRCPEQKGSDVVAEVTQIVTERATRLVVLDKDGNRYVSEGQIRGEGDGLVRHVHRFRKLDKSNIEHVEFQARDYDYWVTFGNVSTQMGYKTKVKVEVNKPGALLKGNALPGFDDTELDSFIRNNKGNMLVICFFDMNQRPSRNCVLELAKHTGILKHNGVAVVIVQASEISKTDIRDWTRDNDLPFPVGMLGGDEENIRFAWGARALPWLILADTQHRVIATDFEVGELNEKIKAAK